MIEIEIRVHVTEVQQKALIADVQFIAEKILLNEIYDSSDYRLTTQEFLLRRRNGVFELKFPATQDGNFNAHKNIPMHEITDEHEIRRVLGLVVSGSLEDAIDRAGYKVLYCFTNIRQTYKNGSFTLDFDTADFGDLVYKVCEIETSVETAEQADQAFASLYDFVKKYDIPLECAEGKLGYYIRMKNPSHYEAIIKSKKHQV